MDDFIDLNEKEKTLSLSKENVNKKEITTKSC